MSRVLHVEHDTRPCTPKGHSAYVGYNAFEGRLISLSADGRPHACPSCDRRFRTKEGLHGHIVSQHGFSR